MNKFREIIRCLFVYINLKTIYFNFRYLPFRDACRLPIFLSRNTKLKRVRGSVQIAGIIKPGMIRIGALEIGIYDMKHNRPIWESSGHVIFDGTAVIKYGAKIIVGKGAKLRLGDNFRISSGSSVICFKKIEFGSNCRISWDSQIIDTDFHKVYDGFSNHLNPDKPVKLGNNCWIGNHCLIQKGTHLAHMVVVSSNSMVNKVFDESHIILAGSPAKIIRTSIAWGA